MSAIKHFGHFVLRSPLFPYDEIRSGSPQNLDELLKEKLKNDDFLEAIFWASPSLFEKTIKMLQGGQGDWERVTRSLKKYLLRASSRCTPFGMFAGCSVGHISGNQDNLVLDAAAQTLRKHVRMDMHLLFTLSNHISHDSAIWPMLRYYPNNSIYEIGNSYRYVEYAVEDGLRHYSVASVEKDSLLDKILTTAREGLLLKDIIGLIDLDADASEMEDYAYELIASQLLVSELELSLTSAAPFASLLGKLRSIADRGTPNRLNIYRRVLHGFQEGIALLNRNSTHQNRDTIARHFKNDLQELGVELNNDNFFQADLYRETPEQLIVSEATIQQVVKGIEALSRFTVSKTKQEHLLEDFKRAFREKYETEEVPLAEVVDAETGIGFPVLPGIGNITDVTLPGAYREAERQESTVEPWHGYLQGQYELATKQGQRVIALREEDIARFPSKTHQLPETFAALFSLLSAGPEKLIQLQTVGGATATALLGRFCHLDPTIQRMSQEIAEKERELKPDAVLAEVLHLPEARVGNILQRPVLREYEIPYLSGASVGEQFALHVSDLTVSVEQDRVLIRSRQLGKQVVPRLSTAHNYAQQSLPVYHFLCTVQHQGKTALGVDWGGWAEGLKFLPRLSFQNVVLSPASWRFTPEDFRHITESDDKLKALCSFIKQWELPPTVAITRADNHLVCHIHRREYQELFLQEIKEENSIHLIEWLHFEESAGPASFTNQIVLPLYQSAPPEVKARNMSTSSDSLDLVQRSFFPGSEWLYVKIYCGAHASDTILTGPVKALVDQLLVDGVIDAFFFIRYADPHYHIRLRLHMKEPAANFPRALSCLHTATETLTRQRTVWKVQVDTYTREVERYSKEFMVLSERIFYHDSALFLALGRHIHLDIDKDSRLLYATQNGDGWLEALGLTLEEKLAFVTSASAAFSLEFTPELKIELDQKYRILRKRVLQHAVGNELDKYLTLRKGQVAAEMAAVNLTDMNALRVNLGSYIHMSMNRWFKTDQRLQEYMVYYFLQKRYTEQLKRSVFEQNR